MNVKEFLSQAYYIHKKINAKLERLQVLKEITKNALATPSDAVKNSTRNFQKMEENITKMLDLEAEIFSDIDRFINAQRDINFLIKNIEYSKYQLILELRYLSFKKWEDILITLGYERRYLYKLHKKALAICERVLKKDTKRHLQDTMNL